jgi:hypothetical protein
LKTRDPPPLQEEDYTPSRSKQYRDPRYDENNEGSFAASKITHVRIITTWKSFGVF